MSLRNRLTLYYAGFFAVTLLLLGCGIFFAVREVLYRGVQQDLEVGTEQMLTLYRAGGSDNLSAIITADGEVRLLARGEFTQFFRNPLLVVQVFSPRGRLLGRAPNLLANQTVPLPNGALGLDASSTLRVVQEVDGTRYVSLVTPLIATRVQNQIVVDRVTAGYLQVTRPLTDVEQTLRTLVLILASGSLMGMVICVGGVALLSRRALRPVERVTQLAQSIVGAEDLAQRVPLPSSQDELHRLTVTINDLLARLEALFVAQRRFVADVSHELRTPLTAMQGNLEILARGGADDRELLDEALADMRRETSRLIRMVNDLLLLAQSDARIPLRCEPVELDTLLLEVFRELRPLAGGAQLRLGAEDQVTVMGDRDRIKQALLNLGMNAIQYTPAGGLVTLGLERRGELACLTVSDTGPGIDADDLPLIWERFYRADRSRSRHSGGAGLGLAIVKRIAEAHHGYATVASAAGQGSTFAIWLPLERAEPVTALALAQTTQ